MLIKKALDTLTMYNRVKFHKYQTVDMRETMKVYKKWLKLHGIKKYSQNKFL
jgi:hypothetical protein